MSSPKQTLRATLNQPVDNTFLVYFRVSFGALLIWSLLKYFRYDLIWTQFLEPQFHFTYFGFDWVKPWPGLGMYAHYLITAIAAACVMVGFRYRLSATVFFLGFSYIFLLDQTLYLNHFYLICLLGFVLIMIPANAALSVDAARSSELRSDTTPTWVLWLLRFQVGLPYVLGGVAKLNSDWIHGEPLRTWLSRKTDFPLIGQYFTAEWCVDMFVWGGLLLDLLVVPLLLWRPTRVVTLVAVWVFHGMNSQLFNIGIFPWLMLAATTLVFLPPEVTSRLRFWKRYDVDREVTASDSPYLPSPAPAWKMPLLSAFVGLQLLIPLRHFLYPGNVAFTREGHCFSWRMKLNIRKLKTNLSVHYEDGTQESVRLWEWITHRQSVTLRNNDQILQLAKHIRETQEANTAMRAEVRGTITVALNGRDPVVLVQDDVDLSRQSRGLSPAPWIERPELLPIASQTVRLAKASVEASQQ